ncbi:MAG: O-methyltransferase [Bacteroidetes bacterium]|nr:O-methyltransferase [Bacteroidota bacterium]
MNDKTFEYCLAHTTAPGDFLNALERETYLRTLSPHMMSGPYQGALLRMISLMLQPKRVLEVGTFTGYAAICLAAGLPEDGQLHTIEADDELVWIIQKGLKLAQIEHKVTIHTGEATQIIPSLEGDFDLVFLDAGKLDYAVHYEMVLQKTRTGGFILADNVLWDGKVAGFDQKDQTALVLRAFNDLVHTDSRVENLLLPLRDGLMLIRKIV